MASQLIILLYRCLDVQTTIISIDGKSRDNYSFEAKFEHKEQVLDESNEIEVRQ